MSSHISNNRRFLNDQLLPQFISKLNPTSKVVDIGKSFKWATLYATFFKDFYYVNVDRDIAKNPDLLLDLENTNFVKSNYSDFADAVICTGVLEHCDNPFIMVENIYSIKKDNGRVLFGIASVGLRIYEDDYCRFTQAGAEKLISKFFKIEEVFPIITNNTLEYIFLICEKTNP